MTQLRETLRISGLTLIGGGRNQSEVRDQKSEIAAHGSFVPAAVIHIALLTGGGDKPYALGIAAALLGDPQTVMLDEPVNGLDPEGIHWIRNLLKDLANEGRTVFVSSHLMSEMALTAEHLIVVGRGRLIADTTTQEFLEQASGNVVHVRTPQADALRGQLLGPDVSIVAVEPSLLEVHGLTAQQIGEIAARHNVVLHELTPQQVSLEEAFMDLTRDDIEFKAGTIDEAAA